MKNLSFAKSIERLEEIVGKLEREDVDLEAAVQLLAEGIALHKICKEKLEKSRTKINNLIIEDEPKD